MLSQTFRTLIHSRMTVGMAAYAERFPNRDLVLFEPQPDDYRMFFTNIFSFGSRKELCEYAYRATRRDLLRRYDELAPVFSRHGIRLRRDVLEDDTLDLWRGVGLGWPADGHVDHAGALDYALAGWGVDRRPWRAPARPSGPGPRARPAASPARAPSATRRVTRRRSRAA